MATATIAPATTTTWKLDPAHVGGQAESQLHFKFPLVTDLKLDAVDYAAKATITGASLDKIFFDRGITDGNFALDIARTAGLLGVRHRHHIGAVVFEEVNRNQ